MDTLYRRLAAVALLAAVGGCGSSTEPEVGFIHAAVADLPEDLGSTTRSATGASASLAAMMRAAAGQLPGTALVPGFVVLAGVGDSALVGTARDQAIAGLLDALQAGSGGPGRQVYLVPRGVGSARDTNRFWSATRPRLAAAGIAIQDLTDCYYADSIRDGGCTADVPGTEVRMVGFPALAATGVRGDTTVPRRLTRWIRVLDTLVTRGVAAGKTVLIATDVPDPTVWAAMGMAPRDVAAFNSIVASGRVIGVLGVRLGAQPPRREHQRLIATPALARAAAADAADGMLGFTLVRVIQRDISPVTFRRLGPELTFAALGFPEFREPAVPSPIRGAIAWFWGLTRGAERLAFWLVVLVAFVVAFLTVIQLWEPPLERPGSPTVGGAGGTTTAGTGAGGASPGGAGAAGTSGTATAASAASSLLSGNVGRAVAAGLSGLLIVSVIDEFLKAAGFNAKAFYIVVFIVLFFILLIVFGLWRAAQEALRHRIATRIVLSTASVGKGTLDFEFWRWLLTWRGTLLAFSDTFSAFLQGKNQSQSAVWTDTILEHHRGMLATAERVRLEIDRNLRGALWAAGQDLSARDVRVNFSLRSITRQALFYVNLSPGSLRSEFGTKSIAWLAVETGQPMWWKASYAPDTVLIDNSAHDYAELPKAELLLKDYYQKRLPQDYSAFLILPFPLRGRGSRGAARGAIHISFADVALFDKLVENADLTPSEPNCGCSQFLFAERSLEIGSPPAAATSKSETCPNRDCGTFVRVTDCEVRAVLQESLQVLETLFAPFDEDFYTNYQSKL